MKMNIHLNNQQLIANLERALENMPGACERLMNRACMVVEAEAKNTAPRDSGTLVNSIKHEVEEQGVKTIGAIYSELDYAPYVHDGTSKMAGRPFLSKATITKRPEVVQVFTDFIDEVL